MELEVELGIGALTRRTSSHTERILPLRTSHRIRALGGGVMVVVVVVAVVAVVVVAVAVVAAAAAAVVRWWHARFD